jgi:hypothetical protein
MLIATQTPRAGVSLAPLASSTPAILVMGTRKNSGDRILRTNAHL